MGALAGPHSLRLVWLWLSAARAACSGARCVSGGPSLFQPVHSLALHLGGSGRAKLVWQALRSGRDPFLCEKVTRRAREALIEGGFARLPVEVDRTVSSDGTVKLLVALEDGQQVESVVIPFEGRPTAAKKCEPRSTLCVSSQVGCSRGCIFCATGRMGLIRNLTPDEILAQVVLAQRVIEELHMPKLHGLVFMGMGEPLNNPASVRSALALLTDPQGFRLASTRISVSTVAPSPSAVRAAVDLPGMLAWSVHAADDEKRKRLVPTTTHTMTELRDAFLEVLECRRQEGRRRSTALMVAVTLLKGINDDPADARSLVELLQPIADAGFKVCVDLIPYNDIGPDQGANVQPLGADSLFNIGAVELSAASAALQRAEKSRISEFQAIVREAQMACFVRVTRGDDEAAACGQLATSSAKRRRRTD